MKKPCPVPVFVHVTPFVALEQLRSPTTVSVLYGRTFADGSITVSPAHTKRPEPERLTARPWPKSTMFGQFDGRGGGDHVR